MRILASNTLLASDSLAQGRVGPFDLAFNGTPIVQVEQLLHADNAWVYGRGDGPVEVTFSITALFRSHAAAVLFCALHRESLPLMGDLEVIDDDAGVSMLLEDAVREVRFAQVRGSAVVVAYKFTGSRFTSEDVPEVPGDADVMKAKEVTLTAAEESKAVEFDTPFASVPRFVRGEISLPDGGTGFFAFPRESTRTAAGVTFDFTLPVPGSGYKLLVIAIL